MDRDNWYMAPVRVPSMLQFPICPTGWAWPFALLCIVRSLCPELNWGLIWLVCFSVFLRLLDCWETEKPMLVNKIFKPDFWLAGRITESPCYLRWILAWFVLLILAPGFTETGKIAPIYYMIASLAPEQSFGEITMFILWLINNLLFDKWQHCKDNVIKISNRILILISSSNPVHIRNRGVSV